ncbi:MAG: hypothetical protein GY903_22140 [Fuerstiella sp.]|nr:hypothetical protein [Fuerstiella sp.]
MTSFSLQNTSCYQLAMVMAARTLQGFAVTLVVVISLTRSELTPIATTSLWVSAALCGMALMAAIPEAGVASVGYRSFFAFRSCCIAVGLFLLWGNLRSEADLAAATLIGLGVGTDWSPMTDCFRRLLSNRNRWHGLRLLSITFPLGMLAGVAAAYVSSEAAALGALLSLLSVPAWFLMGPTSTVPANTAEQKQSNTGSANLAPAAVAQASEATITDAGGGEPDQTDCSAVVRCGDGGDFQRTSFQQGVLISVVGFSAVWGCAFDILKLVFRDGGYAAAVATAAGLAGGTWLLFSVAPRVGYIVAILPFLVLGGVITIACGLVSPTSSFFVVICLLSGMLVGGVACGCSAMIGELFSDRPDDAARSRVISVSLFACAVLVLLTGILRPLLQSAETIVMLNSVIFPVGVFAVRGIPGPVISSLGRNVPSDAETEAELEDIVASINS